MWSTRFAAAALAITGLAFSAACSRDEGEPSLVSEARADAPNAKDYGWRTNPSYPAKQQENIQEYY
ncbi:MAG TPA: hypothetical protein VGJ74_01890 [Burkholderiales bacterium]|jgi:hypothetical protein